MKKQALFILTLTAALVGASAQASAQNAPAAAASDPASTASAAAPAAITPATILISGPAGTVTVGDFEQEAGQMVAPSQRAMFWASADNVKRAAQSIYERRALVQEALQEKLDSTPEGITKLKLTREQALAELLLDARGKASLPDDKALQTYARNEMQANPKQFQIPEQISVRHILLPIAKDDSDRAAVRARAQDLLAQLRKGADFAELAKANSKDPGSAAKGGELGFFGRGKMVGPFEEAAFDLKKPGDLAGPVFTPFGFHIIELLARKPARQQSLSEVQQLLREQLIAQRSKDARKQLLEKIQGAAQVNQANIDALQQQQAAQNQP